MARPRKYVIKLTDDELKTLKSIIRKSNTSKTIRSRCQIIIDLDEAHGKVLTHEQSARSNGVCLTTVTNTVTKYFSGGIEAVTEFKRNINSDNARRILMDVQKHVLLNLPAVLFQKVIPDGLCVCWKKKPK
ncbi:MAG: helix-turn-helix domain-containing protein [Mediterraneibacter gnavus]